MSRGADVVAAGALIARRGGREVLLVHRPKYDDWSFPKGKQDPGESVIATAVREVYEETGLRVHLGRPLPPQYYEIRADRSKVVNYWVARCDRSAQQAVFTPNEEVDEVRWLSVAEAARRLSYLDDCEVLDAFRVSPRRTAALIVLRHAAADKRFGWNGPESERPLLRAGRVQASSLVSVLDAFGIRDLHSSPSQRCVQTLLPYAESQVLQVATHRCLSEEEAATSTGPTAIAALLSLVLASRTGAVLCSHRPVIPEIFGQLGVSEEALAPGECVVFHHRSGHIHGTERHLAT